MSIESVKSLVARLHKDPEFKEKFASSRDEALSGYDLTVEERGAIIRLGIGDSPKAVAPLGTWY